MFKDGLWHQVDVFAPDRDFIRTRQATGAIETSKVASIRRWSTFANNNLPDKFQNSDILMRALIGAGLNIDDIMRLMPRKKQI
jgi:hypothetical protein